MIRCTVPYSVRPAQYQQYALYDTVRYVLHCIKQHRTLYDTAHYVTSTHGSSRTRVTRRVYVQSSIRQYVLYGTVKCVLFKPFTRGSEDSEGILTFRLSQSLLASRKCRGCPTVHLQAV